MKKEIICLLLALLPGLLAGCGQEEAAEDRTIRIAVMRSATEGMEGFRNGLSMALEDCQAEYGPLGYDIQCDIFEDRASYEEGAAIIDRIVSDGGYAAVLGSESMPITKTAAYAFQQAGILTILPFPAYDSVTEEGGYPLVLSACFSARRCGDTLRRTAGRLEEETWAVLYHDDEFSRAEARSFALDRKDGIAVADCAKLPDGSTALDGLMERWTALGVEGVLLLPGGDRGFELVRDLKARDPALTVMGDYRLDNYERMCADPKIQAAFDGVWLPQLFDVEHGSDPGNFEQRYDEQFGGVTDTWAIQSYNCLRMAVDTAVACDSTEGAILAERLRAEGYEGVMQSFRFNENGGYECGRQLVAVIDGATGEAAEAYYIREGDGNG